MEIFFSVSVKKTQSGSLEVTTINHTLIISQISLYILWTYYLQWYSGKSPSYQNEGDTQLTADVIEAMTIIVRSQFLMVYKTKATTIKNSRHFKSSNWFVSYTNVDLHSTGTYFFFIVFSKMIVWKRIKWLMWKHFSIFNACISNLGSFQKTFRRFPNRQETKKTGWNLAEMKDAAIVEWFVGMRYF